MSTSVRSSLPASVHSPSPAWRDRAVAGWAATVARLGLAAVFAVAGLAKIGDPTASVRAVRAYQLLPDGLESVVGRGLPAVELALAVALLLGVALRTSALTAAGLLIAFTIGIVSAAARGLRIDCGCFGGGGPTENPHYTGEIVRDVALLVLAVGLAWLGRSRFALTPRAPLPPALEGLDARQAKVVERRHLAALARHRERRRLLAAAVVGAVLLSGATGVALAAATAPALPTAVPVGVTAAGGIVVGQPNAPHTVIAYEDPQCPICGQFEQTSGAVLARAVAAGQVKVEYRMRSFLGPESVRAVAALGAAQDAGRFAQLRAALFAHQPQEGTGGFTVADLLELGAGVGLTDAQFVDAVRNQTYAPWARQIDDRASRDGNTGTPELLLDGKSIDPTALRAALQG
ncbi:MAG TPA: MauE/DoxX family redox-associated membrane protein [Sporichthya sp.]|nr:MauE/DoxX family redox-associated membrane protein [Sporichthya sp.]